ncbi:MAG TPA: CoA transferase [Chloroflexota bacterium]|jgi:crotonobetainyl-CoA:carnitine CoA-transferase CaiB-like acyl-CoA transferase
MARILDLATHAAAYATRLLAEVGHDVIRVEPPEGDALRRLEPFLGDTPDLEHGAYHQFLNAGKRSFALDLSTAAGRDTLLALSRTADALVGTLPVPADEAALRAANPRLVVVMLEEDDPELCAYARSGLLSITGHPDAEPALLGGHAIYTATGGYTAVATAAALYAQAITGQGQVVRVSVEQCLESLMEQAMLNYTAYGRRAERRGLRGAVTAVSGSYRCADGYWMISVPATPDGWASFVDWTQDPALMADPSLADEAERSAKQSFILDRLESWASRLPKDELVAEAQRRHIPASPVASPLDLVRDPQLVARGFVREVEHPAFGQVSYPLGAVASMRGACPSLAPTLGQHNAEILAELGM